MKSSPGTRLGVWYVVDGAGGNEVLGGRNICLMT